MRVAALYDKWRGGFDCKAQRAVMVHHAVTVGCRLWFRFGTPALVAKRHGAFSSKIAATGSSLAPPTLLQLVVATARYLHSNRFSLASGSWYFARLATSWQDVGRHVSRGHRLG